MEGAITVSVGSLYFASTELIAFLRESFHEVNFGGSSLSCSRRLWNEILDLHALLEGAVKLGLDTSCFDGSAAEEASRTTKLVHNVIRELRRYVIDMLEEASYSKSCLPLDESLLVDHFDRFEAARVCMSEMLNKLQV